MTKLNITLDKFQPRFYQERVLDDIELNGIRRFINVWCRRSGKDTMWWNEAILQCLMAPIMVLYCFPTLKQARQCIWDALTIDGKKFLSFIPKETIANINNSEMKITFLNGSILMMASALKYDNSIVGSNCKGVIFSEAGQMDNLIEIYEYLRPILASNDGFVVFQSTPRGRNDFYTLWQRANENPSSWHASLLTAYDTKHISEEVLAIERKEMTEDKFLQEYMCDFNRGQESLVFGKSVDKLNQEDRFTIVNYDPTALVHVCFDLGWEDSTALIWFQVYDNGQRIHIIDAFSDNHLGLNYYIEKIRSKPYRMGTVFGCHDMMVHEIGAGGRTRLHMAQDLGMDMTVLQQVDKEDSIEQCLLAFPKIWIDSRNCKRLMEALENYRREWDEVNKRYTGIVHDWASDYADSFRYMVQAISLLEPGLKEGEFDRIRREALYGNRSNYFGPLKNTRRF